MKKSFILPLIVASSCSATSYKTYGISTDEDGTVREYLGKSSKEDLPLSACAPRADARYPCRMLTVDEQQKIEDYIASLEERLQECEDR
jgi:hypothetical protein